MDPHRVLVFRGANLGSHIDSIVAWWSGVSGSDDAVLFKPNLIHHRHLTGGDYSAVVTQPEVLDLAWRIADTLSLGGPRSVADAPQGDANFETILKRTGLDRWGDERGVRLVDLRSVRYEGRRDVVVKRHALPGDPAGAVRVNLGRMSAFHGVEGRTFYGADYDIEYTNAHHAGDRHEYLFSGTALESGIVFNLPKLKTHKKAGVTLSMKNLVGLNADKNLLPHYSLGTPLDGGDAYVDSAAQQRFEARLLRSVKPMLRRSAIASHAAGLLKPLARRVLGDTLEIVRSGNWWGNDTVWRMIVDLNRILLYARPDGSLGDSPQRRTLVLVDGIVAGNGNGPEAPDPLRTNIVIAGVDFVAVDIVATTFMGFDYRLVPHLAHAVDPHPLPLTTVDVDKLTIESNVAEWSRNLWEIDPDSMFRFTPHFGWRGHIERRAADRSVAV